MEEMNTQLIMDLTVIPEEYGDEWAFRIRELGFTLYADTREEGPDLVSRAITTLLLSFGSDLEALFSYLDNHGVPYHISRAARMIPEVERIRGQMAQMWGGGRMSLDRFDPLSSDPRVMSWPEIDSPGHRGICIFRHAEDLVGRVTS